jgi:putative Holliday junction resolvase
MPGEVPQVDLPRYGRLVGIDFGTKRHGIAISTPEQNIASPLDVCTRRGPAADTKWFRELLEEYPAKGFVVGLPLHTGGEEGVKAGEAREFGSWLVETIGLPVAFWDERYTTAVAEDSLLEAGLSRDERKARRDMLAAQIILQSYLDSRGGSSQAR